MKPSSTDTTSPKPGKFVSWLHRSYMQSSAVSHFIGRRITRIGFATIGIFVMTVAMAGGKPVRSLFQVLGITAAAVGFALIWTFCRRARASAVRHLPANSQVGQPLSYSVDVTNLGRRSLLDAWILEGGSDTRPTLARFSAAREPGEENRNTFDKSFRFYRWMWLNDLNEVFPDSSADRALDLKAGETTTVTINWTPARRGCVSLKDIRLLLPDPLGLFQRCRRVEQSEDTLTVFPEQYHTSSFRIPGGSRGEHGESAQSIRTGDSQEFAALRDYRPGDQVRNIHWKTWARSGRAVVKEFEQSNASRYSIWLDTLPGVSTSPELFENAIKVAAGFAATRQDQDAVLDCIITASEVVSPHGDNDRSRRNQLMTHLAKVGIEENPSEKEARTTLLAAAQTVSGCVFICHDWTKQRRDLVRAALNANLDITLIGISLDPEKVGAFPAPVSITHLNEKHFTPEAGNSTSYDDEKRNP